MEYEDMTFEEKLAEQRRLSGVLSLSISLMRAFPEIYMGECEKVSIGFDFSRDGIRFSTNAFNPKVMEAKPRLYFLHSIAVLTQKNADGKAIGEIRVPAKELPADHLPEFWRPFAVNSSS